MNNRHDLGRRALRAALRARRQAGIPEDAALSIHDFAERHFDIEVWFVDVPSLEGMYQKDSPGRILVSSHRTPGRQAMTCAHELGHHVFGHGTQVDDYMDDASLSHNLSPDEMTARLFASFLLMPALAVERAIEAIGTTPVRPDPIGILTASHYLGVSYEALIQHMRWSLRLIDDPTMRRLQVATRKSLVTRITEEALSSELVVAGVHWTSRAIDLSVGDACVLPTGSSVDDAYLSLRRSVPSGDLYVATRQGVTRTEDVASGWASYIRISRARFAGRNAYRHMEDPDEYR